MFASVFQDWRPTKVKDSLNELNISKIGLGTAQLGNLFRETSEEESLATIDQAWEEGIRYFDTAPHYGLGLSEKRVGEALRLKNRSEFVISTKVGRLLIPTPENANNKDDQGFDVPAAYKREWDFSRDGIFRSVEESLNRTGLDYFDILYLHDPDDHFEQASTEGISALIELREQGAVKAVGAGMNYAAPLAELIRRADIDLVMCAGRFSLLDSSALDDLLPTALRSGVGVIAAGVYNSGLLSKNKPSNTSHFDYKPAPQDLITRAVRIADVCQEYGVSLPEAAIAYVMDHPAVLSVVLGARGTEQVAQNVKNSKKILPDELWGALVSEGLIKEYQK